MIWITGKVIFAVGFIAFLLSWGELWRIDQEILLAPSVPAPERGYIFAETGGKASGVHYVGAQLHQSKELTSYEIEVSFALIVLGSILTRKSLRRN